MLIQFKKSLKQVALSKQKYRKYLSEYGGL